MPPTVIFSTVRKRYEQREKARRLVVERGDEAVRRSKQAIFALQRGDQSEGARLLGEAQALLASCDASIRAFSDLAGEGPYVAGLEEYAEGRLFAGYVKNGKIGAVEKRAMDSRVYLAGLCDATGEIVRYAMREAAQGRHEAVHAAYATVEAVVTYLLDMDLTGYLRTKFDQAKRNLRSLEQMVYELSIRK